MLSRSQGERRKLRKWYVYVPLLLTLIFAGVWIVHRLNPHEKLVQGSWLSTASDGSRTLWIASANHRWTAWDVDESGRRTTKRASGRWSFDGKVIELREEFPGSSPIDILLQRKSYDLIYLEVESLQPDRLVTRFRTNGDRLEWTRQSEVASP